MVRGTKTGRSDQKAVENEVARLRDLDIKGLWARWKGVFRRAASPNVPRHLLLATLAYRIQADRFGDLDPLTKKALDQTLGSDPRATVVERLGKLDRQTKTVEPGTVLTREWRGKPERVMVMTGGFSWRGKTYPSLSAVAFAITHTKWNGPKFFGLREAPKTDRAEARP